MVRKEYLSAVSPIEWDQDYKKAALVGKLINLVPEINNDTVIPGAEFKSVVGCDRVTARETYGKAFSYHSAKLRIGDIEKISVIPPGAKEVTFKVTLPNGLLKLSPVFISDEIEATPYYAYITHQSKAGWQTPKGMNIPIYDSSRGRVPPQLEKPTL